ncbi:MAG: carboxypeptidase regulatory-like domain-containing protein [Candidatus Brocadiaceae bacterium]|nr:carboxypeptidase regulatory-like domain-containing protein [Candidatus Brocadiaceae bacterium]
MKNIQHRFLADMVLKFASCFFCLVRFLFPAVLVFSWFVGNSHTLFSDETIYHQTTGSVPYYSQAEVSPSQSAANAPIVITGPASRVTYDSATIQGMVNARGLSTTVWLQYRIVNGASKSTGTTQTVIGTSDTEISVRIIELLPASTYYYRLVAKNDAGTSYGREMSFTTVDINSSISTEIIPPNGSVKINGGNKCTNSLTVTLNLFATDNTGVTGYYLSTSAIPPSIYSVDWKSIPETRDYRENVPYTFTNGDDRNTVYVWYKDASGNISDTASSSVVVDITPPVVTIQQPTSDRTYTTTSETISIGGNASDNLTEISSIVWTNNRGKKETERNTLDWIIPHIELARGDNVITVKATDSMGNAGVAKITITYTTDNNTPVVKTGVATSVTAELATLNGTVHAMGLATTAWFQYGTSSGHYSNMSPIQDSEDIEHDIPIGNRISGLKSGTTYYYRLVAQNSAGATSGTEMTFTTLPLKGKIYGKAVSFAKGEPIASAKLRLKGTKARKKGFHMIFSDAHGFFTFDNLDADTYDIIAAKTNMETATQIVELKDGEEKKMEITLKSREEDKKEVKDSTGDQQKTN